MEGDCDERLSRPLVGEIKARAIIIIAPRKLFECVQTACACIACESASVCYKSKSHFDNTTNKSEDNTTLEVGYL